MRKFKRVLRVSGGFLGTCEDFSLLEFKNIKKRHENDTMIYPKCVQMRVVDSDGYFLMGIGMGYVQDLTHKKYRDAAKKCSTYILELKRRSK